MNGHVDSDPARAAVDQLRRENNFQRIKVSQAASELVKYVQENEKDDYLMTGFPSDKMNPYRPKSSFQCSVL